MEHIRYPWLLNIYGHEFGLLETSFDWKRVLTATPTNLAGENSTLLAVLFDIKGNVTLKHRAWIIALTARKHVSRLNKRSIQEYKSEWEYWRAVLTRIISVLRLITERGLALRCSKQTIGSTNNGNYPGCSELINWIWCFTLRAYLQTC